MASVAAPPRYQRRPGTQRPPRASPAPSLPRSRSRSVTPGGPPRCTHCNQPTLAQEEGAIVCQSCGVVVEQDGNFRADVEFDESSSGAIQTRGTLVGANQTHQRHYQLRVPGAPNVGLEASITADKAKQGAKRVMEAIARSLNINIPEINRGTYLFDKAYQRQFYRGRTMDGVAVACLYLAVRQYKGPERYALMLIDFAEAAQPQLNVFELGKWAKELQAMLYLKHNQDEWAQWEAQKLNASDSEKTRLTEKQVALSLHSDALRLQDPEDLIERFCDRLDFGEKHMIVKRDAARIAKGMNREWMTTGRRPAGIAGAAVIIAARMNNYRRTLREVVLVAKVTEITLSKRIEEFKETRSSNMSIKEFRATGPDSIGEKEAMMPPSYYRAQPEWQEKQAAKKRKRRRKNGKLPDTAAEIENDEDIPTEIENETDNGEEEDDDEEGEEDQTQPQSKRPRLDADGFAVPALPVRPSSTQETEERQPKKLGKPKGAKNWRPPPPTEADLAAEDELTEDIADQLRRNAALDPTGTIAQGEPVAASPAPGPGILDIYPAPRTKDVLGPAVNSSIGNTGSISVEEDVASDEFEDDPDVANCVLNESERIIKETIWVTENADWLRTEHAKKIKRELKDRELREKGIDPDKERQKKVRRKDGMQRAGRAGDISYLEEARNKRRDQDGQQPDRGTNGGPSRNPAVEGIDDEEAERQRQRSISHTARESVTVMLQQRGTFSRRVDYDKLSQAYVLPGFEDSSDSRSESPDSSRFFKPATSRGIATSNMRRARTMAGRIAGKLVSNESEAEGVSDNEDQRPSRSRSRSAPQTNDDEEEEAEQDTGRTRPPRRSAGRDSSQMLTPTVTQSQPRATSVAVHSESPLSSTHTPAGYGSGASGTPQATAERSRKQNTSDAAADEDESEGDEDDYVDEEDNEEDDEDDDPDKYFGAGGELMTGEAEEVVDE